MFTLADLVSPTILRKALKVIILRYTMLNFDVAAFRW